MGISIVHPSRSRPELARETYYNWMRKAANPNEIEYIMSVDRNDPRFNEYYNLRPGENERWPFGLHIGDGIGAIRAMNAAAQETTGDIIIGLSDDFDCPWHWDVHLLSYFEGKKDVVAKAQDGIQPWMHTLPIMDRTFYNRFGYIYNPEYHHMYADLELSCVGDMLGKTIQVPVTFRHLHYTQKDGIKKDEVTAKNDSTYGQGERVFLERAKRYFDLKAEDIVSKVNPDPNCRRWFEQKGINL